MEKKTIDLLNNIDVEILENIDLTDEEIDSITQNIDLERIEKIAIKKISTKKKKINIFRLSKKINVLAATLILLIGGTTLAMGYSAFKDFYGEKANVIEEKVQVIRKSITADNITMQIEEAISSKHLQLIFISFTKDDGSKFEQGEHIEELKVNLGGAIPLNRRSHLVEDGKKLLYCVEGIRRDNMQRNQVVVSAERMVNGKAEVISDAIWTTEVELEEIEGRKRMDLNIPITCPNNEYIIQDVEVSEIGVYVKAKNKNQRGFDKTTSIPSVELKTVEGEIIPLYDARGTSGNYEVGFQYEVNLEEKQFLNPEEIEFVIIEGVEIGLDYAGIRDEDN